MKKIKKIMILSMIIIGAIVISGGVSALSGWTIEGKNGDNIYKPDIVVKPFTPITSVIDLSVDTGFYLIGKDVIITLENNGDRTADFYGPSYHWIIEQHKDNSWEKIYPYGVEICLFQITQIVPGESEVAVWHQTCSDGDVNPGKYRVVVDYSVDDPKYSFVEYSYFTIGGVVVDNYHELIDSKPVIDEPECVPISLPNHIIVTDLDASMIVIDREPIIVVPNPPMYWELPPVRICD